MLLKWVILSYRSGDYQKEMQACREGRTGEDRATCLREARNARADKRRGVLTTPGVPVMWNITKK